jgi:hypothetical protein
MTRFRSILILALVLTVSTAAYGAALGTAAAVGTTTAVTDTTFTQTFTWSFNADQGTDEMVGFDFSKCKSMTRAFDASIGNTNSVAKYELYGCDSAATDKANCRKLPGGPFSEHSATAMSASMFSKPYGMVYPSTVPGGTDVATVTFSCAVDDWVYDEATEAWVASDGFNPGDSQQKHDEVMTYMNDFTFCADSLEPGDDLDLTNDWRPVDIGATITADPSTFCIDDSPNGILRLIADATDAEGNSLLMDISTTNGRGLLPAADRTITVEWRCTNSDWDKQHTFMGIFETTTDPVIDADGDIDAGKEFVGFHHNGDDDADAIPALIYAGTNNTETEAVAVSAITALTDATYYRFKVRITDTDNVAFFIDDVLVAQKKTIPTAAIFSAVMYPAVAAINAEGVADTHDCDYVRVTQTR